MRKKTGSKNEEKPKPKGVFGSVKMLRLDRFQPNAWNPNRMTPFIFESLREDMRVNGWPASQALLVWGKDSKGVSRDVIIDGEHRQRAALEIGYETGPVVVVDGLTEIQAKQWTIKLDNKRGTFDPEPLGELVREISGSGEIDPMLLGSLLGFEDVALKALLSAAPPSIPPEDFRDVDVNVTTTYCCPKCNYEWSGSPK